MTINRYTQDSHHRLSFSHAWNISRILIAYPPQLTPMKIRAILPALFSPYDRVKFWQSECLTKTRSIIIFTNIYQAIIKVRYFLYVIAAILAAPNVVTLNMINLIFPNIYKAEMKAAISEEVKEKKITTLWITLNDI